MSDPDEARAPEQAAGRRGVGGGQTAADHPRPGAARGTAGVGPTDERRGQSDALSREMIEDRNRRLGAEKGGKK